MKGLSLTRPRHFLTRLLLGLLQLCPLSTLALEFALPAPGDDLVGQLQQTTTRYEDTLSDLARRYDLGYREITQANPTVDPWLPGEGTRVLLPTRFILPPGPRHGMVINLAELRIYFYPADRQRVITYPLGIGREGWRTPTGQSRIIRKQANPDWRPPRSIRQEYADRGDQLPSLIKAGPDNPLGQYALYLDLPGYLLHGTNRPYGVGMRVSHGCIRLYPEDIERLFRQVPLGTPVRIINRPYKTGWHQRQLYIETHLPLEEEQRNLTPLVSSVLKQLKRSPFEPDWTQIRHTFTQSLGIPVAITPAGDFPQ